MKKEDLKQSKIEFYKESHQYVNPDTGKELSGITGIIKDLVFPDKYTGVSEEVLKAAAERGTVIHDMCEEFAINGTVEAFMPDEVQAFVNHFSISGTKFIAAEYLVSDEQNIATMIDLVDEDGNLYDIKTTSTLDKEYLSWQLSICACLFEIQNIGKTAGKLFGIWLKGDRCEVVEVKRLPDDAVDALLVAYLEGTFFTNPMKNIDSTDEVQMAKIAEVEEAIIRLETQVKSMKEVRQQYVDYMLAEMKSRGVKTLETEAVKLTLKDGYTRSTIDTEALKKDMPDVAAKYEKTSKVNESLIIKIK